MKACTSPIFSPRAWTLLFPLETDFLCSKGDGAHVEVPGVHISKFVFDKIIFAGSATTKGKEKVRRGNGTHRSGSVSSAFFD